MILTHENKQLFTGLTIGKIKEIIRIFNFPDDYSIGQTHAGHLIVLASEKHGQDSIGSFDPATEKFTVFDEGF